VQALIKPIYGIALMLFYYDQRIRLEGYDIEWMMQQAGLVAPIAIEAAAGTAEIAAEAAAPTFADEVQPVMAIEPGEIAAQERNLND
jgi:hypothetical protein